MPPVKDKSFNHFIIVVGIPESGKSAYGLRRAVELGKTPAYVLAHDAGYRLPDHIYDDNGREHPVKVLHHTSVEAGAQALAKQPGGVHAFAIVDGMPVLELAKSVSKRSLEKHGGKVLVPTVVLIDEGVSVADMNAYRIGVPMKEVVTLRRHYNVGVIITIQDPRFIHYSLAGLSTEIVMFRTQDDEAIAHLARMGVPKALAAKSRSLAQYKYLVHRGGFAQATGEATAANDETPDVEPEADSEPQQSLPIK